jgi:hypothetical protein
MIEFLILTDPYTFYQTIIVISFLKIRLEEEFFESRRGGYFKDFKMIRKNAGVTAAPPFY